MLIKPGQNQIKFVERSGIKFFKPFLATNKYGDTVQVRYGKKTINDTKILVSNEYGRDLGECNLNFIKDERTIHSRLLRVYEGDEGKGIGELLGLTGLLELWGNNWNNFKLFSLRQSMGFFAKLGFKLDTDDADYIIEGLKYIKRKAKINPEAARNAEFFLPKVQHYPESLKDDEFLLDHSANVISKYMKEIMRRGQKRYMPNYECGSHFKFTDWEFLTEKNYLNHLLEKHNIDFRF